MTLDGGNGRPTMHDVAQLAGVSHQTVSRVLNGHPNIRQQTRARVERAIGQLHYRPNTAARALVTNRSATLGVVVAESTQYGPARTLIAIEEAARLACYYVNFVSLRQVDRSGVLAALTHLTNASVAGILAIAPLSSAAEVFAGQPIDVPLVTIGSGEGASPAAVAVDHAAGARAATCHLLDLGHETVLHLRGPAGWLDAEARERGWLAELAHRQAPILPPLVGDWSARSGYEAGLLLSSQKQRRTTAIFAANDEMAIGVLRGLNVAGIRVPQDISVVGFDDIPEAAYLQVPLTTVSQDLTALGEIAVSKLLMLVNGSPQQPRELEAPQLVPRLSSGSPKRWDR